MFAQILIGFILIILSVVIQLCFIEFAARFLKKIFKKPEPAYPGFGKFVMTMSGLMFWLLVSLSIIIWMWAFVLIKLSVFSVWEESLYFSLVAFTTLGFGDVTLPENWRLLSGFVAADGFVLFGLNTAVLLEAMMRLRNTD